MQIDKLASSFFSLNGDLREESKNFDARGTRKNGGISFNCRGVINRTKRLIVAQLFPEAGTEKQIHLRSRKHSPGNFACQNGNIDSVPP